MTKLQRNYNIWKLSQAGYTDLEIIEEIPEYCSRSIVWHALKNLEKLGNKKAINEYFAMGNALEALVKEEGDDPDNCVIRMLNALWLYELATRAKLKKLSDDEFENFMNCKQMRHTNECAKAAMRNYRARLKNRKAG